MGCGAVLDLVMARCRVGVPCGQEEFYAVCVGRSLSRQSILLYDVFCDRVLKAPRGDCCCS